jgi:hypothetical protein
VLDDRFAALSTVRNVKRGERLGNLSAQLGGVF